MTKQRYAVIGAETYHVVGPGWFSTTPHRNRTACGMVVLPERGDAFFDEPPADRRPCKRCQRTEEMP